MTADVVCFEFQPEIALDDAEMSLHLAMFAIEGIFGRAQVRLETEYQLEEQHHQIVVGAANEIGATLVRVFTALLLREYGEDAFHIVRSPSNPQPAIQEACA